MMKGRNFQPAAHQQIIIDAILKDTRVAVFAFMGSGKTAACLLALEKLKATEAIYPALIIAPIRVAKTTWPDEAKKWDFSQHLKVTPIVGSEKQRLGALDCQSDIYTTNYENLPWLVEHFEKKWPFKTIIADESTRLKGFRTRQGSKRAKALAKVAHSIVKRVVLLTGTPAPNGLLDLWGQMWFLDAGLRLGTSFSKFCTRWFYEDYSGFNWLPFKHAQHEIQEAIKDICITIKAEDWYALDAPIVHTIDLRLPPKAEKIYKDFESKMFAELENTEITALSAASKSMQCRQLAAGAIYDDFGNWSEVHDEKIRALESIIEEANGMPIIVAYHFRHDLQRLQKAFPRGKELGVDPAIQLAWNRGEIPLLFIHPTSAGTGLNLQDGSNIMVFFSLDGRMEDHVQVIERIGPMRQKQSGHNRSVHLYYLLMRNTIDEIMLDRLKTKKSVQEVLLDAMNKYKLKRQQNEI